MHLFGKRISIGGVRFWIGLPIAIVALLLERLAELVMGDAQYDNFLTDLFETDSYEGEL